MDALEFLTWTRGPGLNLALLIFVLGTLWRLIEIYGLGRKQDLSAPRHTPGASGMATIFRRSLPPPGMLPTSPVSYIGGYTFHIGLAIVVFLFAPHIKLVEGLIGLSACLQGEVNSLLRNERYDAALDAAKFYRDVLDGFYLELQDHGNPVRFRNIWVRELKDVPHERVAEPKIVK